MFYDILFNANSTDSSSNCVLADDQGLLCDSAVFLNTVWKTNAAEEGWHTTAGISMPVQDWNVPLNH